MALLISFAGLPGVGKTTLAKRISQRFGCTYVRVDVIEAALRESTLNIDNSADAGYLAACAIAKSNLRLGNDVVADTVNPLAITRSLWSQTATAAQATLFNIEIICSDKAIHRHRVETRQQDILGHPLPDWQRVLDREYEPWDRVDLSLDTANLTPDAATALIVDAIQGRFDKSTRD